MYFENAAVALPQTLDPDKKYFSIEEANRALPYVARIVDDATRAYQCIIDLRRYLDQYELADPRNDSQHECEQQMDRLSYFIDELSNVGVQLKDFEVGVVDFPAIFEDREVFLCWKKGELQVEHWHEIDEGYTGRQALTLWSEDQADTSSLIH